MGLRVIPKIPTGALRLLSGGRSVTIDGNTLDPTLQLMLSVQRAAGIERLIVEDDPVASRREFRKTAVALGGAELHAGITELSIPGPAGEIRARHYRPAGVGPRSLLVYFHGGGWVVGDLDSYNALCRLTCRNADIQVLSIDYRLAPEHKAPASLDDAYAAFLWAHEHAAELGGIPGRVAVGGDSAGGNLSAAVSLRARDDGGPLPVLQWLIYPSTDQSGNTRSRTLFANGFLLTKRDIDWFSAHHLDDSGVQRTDPRVSPLLAEDLSGLSPALVVTAGFDPLRDEGDSYAAALRAAGNIVDHRQMGSMIHGFANLFPLGGGSAVATAEMISAVRAHLSRT